MNWLKGAWRKVMMKWNASLVNIVNLAFKLGMLNWALLLFYKASNKLYYTHAIQLGLCTTCHTVSNQGGQELGNKAGSPATTCTCTFTQIQLMKWIKKTMKTCDMMDILLLKSWRPSERQLTPSILTHAAIRDDFPAPIRPTTPTWNEKN